ncbi:histidine kinase [Xanthobacteraceae bacterium Astr-EGSB]|nr:histidine kinase [Xanthobacteraceae bacterium Astr-EGSB]
MPSLFRFLMAIGVLAGLVYAGMFALATMVEPQQRDMTVTISPDRFVKPR